MRAELSSINQMQRLFINAYAGDVVEAMKIAGYKGDDKALKYKGNQLLKDKLIKEAIIHRDKYVNRTNTAIASRDERQKFWTEIMMNKDVNARQDFDKHGNPLPPDIKPNIPLRERLKASELLGKSEGDFVDRVQMDANITLNEIVMKSYQLEGQDDDIPVEDIEAEYYRIHGDDDQKETDPPEEKEPPKSGYSFL